MSFDHLQKKSAMTGWISNRVGMTELCAVCCVFCFVSSLFHLRICLTFVFVLPTNWPGLGHFCVLPFISFTMPDIFFNHKIFVGHLVRHSGVLIVRQISTALLHTVSAILFVFMKIGKFSAQGLNFRKMYLCILVNSADS